MEGTVQNDGRQGKALNWYKGMEEKMEEVNKAVMAWKVANGQAKAPEHQGWSKARRENLLVNGVYAISKANTIKGRK